MQAMKKLADQMARETEHRTIIDDLIDRHPEGVRQKANMGSIF